MAPLTLATAFLALLPAIFGSAIPATHHDGTDKVLTDIYGPKDTWKPIYAIDVNPHSTYNGAPVDSKLIVGYTFTPTPSQAAATKDRLHGRKANQKRDGVLTCYNSGAWVGQYQLARGQRSFCNDAPKTIAVGNYHAQNKYLWQDDNGAWKKFTRETGAETGVFYQISMKGGSFNWGDCVGSHNLIVEGCRGNNPDTAGGIAVLNGHEAYMDPNE
jgi:hypothetical protein